MDEAAVDTKRLIAENEALRDRVRALEKSLRLASKPGQPDGESLPCEALYEMILETTMDGYWESDVEGRIVEVNDVYCRMTGYSREELVGQLVSSREAVESAGGLTAHVEKLVSRGEDRFETRHRCKDGSILDVEASLRHRAGPGGRCIGFFRDITGCKQAERSLRESEKRSRNFIQTAQEGFGEIDPGGRILSVNPRLEEMFGYSRGEMVGLDVRSLLVPEERPAMAQYLARRQQGESQVYEQRFRRKNGEHFWLIVSATPIKAEDGQVIGSFAMMTDITEQKQAQEALQELHAELELRVANRTEELKRANAELQAEISERKRAEEERRKLESKIQQTQRLESLGVLAGGIAHDFNNLLVGVLGNSELALRKLPGRSPIRESLMDIRTAALSAADLCRQMLAYAGKGQFVLGHHHLSRVVEETRKILSIAPSKKAVLTCRLAHALPTIKADRSQLQQVAMNLIINASEALGEQGGTINIATGTMDCAGDYLRGCQGGAHEIAPGEYVYLEVADDGSGMDAATQGRVFEPFFSTKFVGRGLGLSAVLGVVNSHQGAIRIDSEIGKGTTVRVLFPVSVEEDRTGSLVEPAGTEATAIAWQGTVLVVDDEPAVRKMMGQMLAELGFEVLTVAGGREASELVAEHPELCFILLDLSMPGWDGVETYRRLQGIRPGVKVVVASGYAEQECQRHFVGLNVAGFIQKPYGIETMRAKIRAVLRE